MAANRRFVFSTFGSFGDVHPYVAIALELQKHGEKCAIATSEFYRPKITRLGIDFIAIRPDTPDFALQPKLMAEIMDLRKGSEKIIRHMLMPEIKNSFEDLLNAVSARDILISHPLTFATSIVAEIKQLKWISTVLQPIGFFSAIDPSVLAPAPWLMSLRFLGPQFYRLIFNLMELTVKSWSEPWHQLRSELGLKRINANPISFAQHSPRLVLALFSKQLAEPQADWPTQTVVTGFPFFDQDGEPDMSPELREFLDSGPPPLVFTLGTTAVRDAGEFYRISQQAARQLNRRAVFLIGKETGNTLPALAPTEIAVEYAPFSHLFPRAEVIVHQGGVGTTGQAMRSGRPMLIMPYAHDQPDHAYRIRKLGIGGEIARASYSPESAAKVLAVIINDQSIKDRAREIGLKVSAENGAAQACSLILQNS